MEYSKNDWENTAPWEPWHHASEYYTDVYSNPRAHQLTPVAEIDRSSGAYEFHLVVVWRHDDGRFFIASDSGCSCPSPFEDVRGLGELEELTDLAQIDAYLPTPGEYDYYTPQQRGAFLDRVRLAMRDAGARP